jgi:N-acetylglucosaminyldiphosphoundecaprenol N-acetyl-beta-D-mannosaminyltransferase
MYWRKNMEHGKVDICGVRHSCIEYDTAIAFFDEWIGRRDKPRQICISNVHTTIMCRRDKELAEIANKSAIVTIDGQPLRWYARYVKGVRLNDRVCGPELMIRSIETGLEKGWRHYFLGGKSEVLSNLCKTLLGKYPGLQIAGCYSPPFKPLTDKEDQEIAERINASRADILWVGLGAPKQEKWIAHNLSRVHVPILIGVGAAFDFHSGNVRRAPRFLQRSGLEWAYRIIQDPRLFNRYLKTNPVFMYLFARDYFQARFVKRTGRKPQWEN